MKILNVVQEETNSTVERQGLDEFYLDVTEKLATEDKRESHHRHSKHRHIGSVCGSEHLYACGCGCTERLRRGSVIASRLRKAIEKKTGFSTSGGIGCSKMAAKLAGSLHKPNQQTTMLPNFLSEFIKSLPVTALPGCGQAISERLAEKFGINLVNELREKLSLKELVAAFGGRTGVSLFQTARGIDVRPVSYPLPQQLRMRDIGAADKPIHALIR